jgi:hypothetical protein
MQKCLESRRETIKTFKGIIIKGEEYKLSQYADDTSIISDGSPESMDGILRELDFFGNISGLKINFSKQTGSKKNKKMYFPTLDGK